MAAQQEALAAALSLFWLLWLLAASDKAAGAWSAVLGGSCPSPAGAGSSAEKSQFRKKDAVASGRPCGVSLSRYHKCHIASLPQFH